jgi:UDP-N-acetyl-2-amino-2-deoxyglucuronate dehydrogenase
MSQKKFNVLILGCGRVASFHAKAITKNNKLNLEACCDLNQSRLKEFKKEFNLRGYTSIDEVFENHKIDIVSICTPSGMHARHAINSMKKYDCHVVIEKPMAMNMREINELRNISKKKKLVIAPIHQYRFNKCVQRLKKAIKYHEMGKPLYASVRMRWCREKSYYKRDIWRGTYSHDGGATSNQGIHHLDLLRYFFGNPKQVLSKMYNYNSSFMEVEDTSFSFIKFKNNFMANVEITTAARPKDYTSSLSVIFERGVAEIGGWATDKLTTFSIKPSETYKNSENFKSPYGYGHEKIYSSLTDCLTKKNKKLLVEFEDASMTINLLNSLYESNSKNNWVKLKKNYPNSRLGEKNKDIDKKYL